MAEHVLIITGGSLDIGWTKKWYAQYQQEFTTVIAADAGLMSAQKAGIEPDQIIGDYDSVQAEVLEQCREQGTQIVTFPKEKDYTDTELAIETALELIGKQESAASGSITILGATGTRLDHTMTNIGLMLKADAADVHCTMYDAHNKIYIGHAGQEYIIAKAEQYGDYVSYMPIGGMVRGLTLRGFFYPLTDYTFESGLGIGVSNVITEEFGKISFSEGKLIIFETKD